MIVSFGTEPQAPQYIFFIGS